MNSLNAPFLARLQNMASADLHVRIALDTDMVGLATTYKEYFEFEYWWGPKFDDDLAKISPGVARHEASERERFFHGISRTEFWWQSRDNQHIFEVEELRDTPAVSGDEVRYGCRYAHAIVDESTGRIDHFDGAIRMYPEEQMVERLESTIAEAGRRSEYTKLWRLDEPVSVSVWKSLLSDYFRDNRLVGEYLGAPPEEREASTVDEDGGTESVRREYVPYSMTRGTGIRVSLSLHPQPTDTVNEREVVSLDTLSSGEQCVRVVELETVELRKALARLGAMLTEPEDVAILSVKDSYVNLPLIVHGSEGVPNSLNVTLEAIRMLVRAWNGRGHDMVASYSLGLPVQGWEARISVLGHIADLEEWLSDPLSIPPTSLDEIPGWGEKVAAFLSERYPEAGDEPPLSETLMMSGLLSIRRIPVDQVEMRFRLFYAEDENALKYEIGVPQNRRVLWEAMQARELAIALAFTVRQSECTKCGGPYQDCRCSKLLDNGVTQRITEAGVALPFWTDRPVV